MAYLREILNHTFLRTIYHTSSRQTKLEYQEVQRNFINDHSNDDPNSKSDYKSKPDYNSKSRERDKNKRGKVPFGEHCRRPSCKQRGTHTTHKHSECRYRDDDKTSSNKHPNLGKAPYKAKDHKSKSDTTSQASLPAASATNNVRKCYTCGDPNHLANAGPQKSKHKQNAKTKLKANKSFLALFKSSFSTQNEQACASRMIDAWDEEGICSSCIQPCFFAHECNLSDSHVTQHVPHVRQTIANSNLLQYKQEAHKPHTNRLQASNPVSLNMSFFLQAEGQDVSNTGELSPIRQHHGNRQASDDDEPNTTAGLAAKAAYTRQMKTIQIPIHHRTDQDQNQLMSATIHIMSVHFTTNTTNQTSSDNHCHIKETAC